MRSYLCLLIALASCNGPTKSSYFVPLPLTQFSSLGAPCLEVELEGQTVPLELDLGFQGEFTVVEPFLNGVSKKTFLRTAVTQGIKGNQYGIDLYRIPEARIGPLRFVKPILQSCSEQFIQDSVIGTPSSTEIGRIGWKLFQNTSLLLDVAQGTIALCNNLQYANFSQTKLLTDRGLLEFEAATEAGPLRCVLDTGATRNIQNTACIEPTFVIGNEDFGPISFQGVPIQISIPINAILGMEFFQSHIVLIDFLEKQVYISNVRGSMANGLIPSGSQ